MDSFWDVFRQIASLPLYHLKELYWIQIVFIHLFRRGMPLEMLHLIYKRVPSMTGQHNNRLTKTIQQYNLQHTHSLTHSAFPHPPLPQTPCQNTPALAVEFIITGQAITNHTAMNTHNTTNLTNTMQGQADHKYSNKLQHQHKLHKYGLLNRGLL